MKVQEELDLDWDDLPATRPNRPVTVVDLDFDDEITIPCAPEPETLEWLRQLRSAK